MLAGLGWRGELRTWMVYRAVIRCSREGKTSRKDMSSDHKDSLGREAVTSSCEHTYLEVAGVRVHDGDPRDDVGLTGVTNMNGAHT